MHACDQAAFDLFHAETAGYNCIQVVGKEPWRFKQHVHPIHMAVCGRNVDVLKLLLEQGASTTQVNLIIGAMVDCLNNISSDHHCSTGHALPVWRDVHPHVCCRHANTQLLGQSFDVLYQHLLDPSSAHQPTSLCKAFARQQ